MSQFEVSDFKGKLSQIRINETMRHPIGIMSFCLQKEYESICKIPKYFTYSFFFVFFLFFYYL